LQCVICCKVKPQIQRELSHTIKSICACIWMYDGYIWWLTSFHYAPWKHISLPNLENNFARKYGLSYSSLFQAGIRVPIVLDISDTYPFFQYFLFFSFFMNNFCIATCLFSIIKLLRDSNKNIEAFSWGISYRVYFWCLLLV
jgi:hypothetical protein